MIARVLQAWRRRYWRSDASALANFAGLRPLTVITGGSDGLGFALAAEFLRLGDDVLLIARTGEKLADAKQRLAMHLNNRAPERAVSVLVLDIASQDALHRIDERLAELGGYCDVLVNCAGVGHSGPFASQDSKALDNLVAVNISALTRLSRHYLPGMIVRGRGGILNAASLGGYVPGPFQAAYYASKAYLISLTEAIAQETAGRGVRVAVMAPGAIRTAFHQRMGGSTGLYLRLFPVLSARRVARAAVMRFRLGQRVIFPGIVVPLMMLALRLLPHPVSVPVMAMLLKPRASWRPWKADR